jgi:hypothetical protein
LIIQKEEVKMNKYLSVDQLSQIQLQINLKDIELVSNDTINELDLFNSIMKCDFKDELFAAACQMAIVGFGGKQYNQYKYKGQTKELKKLFQKFHMTFNNELGANLNTEDYTPRRLLRIFRYHIHKALNESPDISSYLFRKYTIMDPKYRTYCFPGAEHLVETHDQAAYLLGAYKKLDDTLIMQKKQHGIYDRAMRVLLARNLIKYNDEMKVDFT